MPFINKIFSIKIVCLIFCFFVHYSFAQTVTEKLEQAVASFEKDAQLENAIFSLYVINATTGEKVFAKNENVGLATASCLKLITSATAFDLLGQNFKFSTKVFHTGTIDKEILNGDLIIQASGDPTLGSWRWEETKTSTVLQRIANAVKAKNIKTITGKIIINDGNSRNVTPSGWIWEDLGNYYGAPARLLNWRENQYDVHFSTASTTKSTTTIITVDPELPNVNLQNEVTTAEEGSGDNSIIYLPPFGTQGLIKGTLPANEKDFVVSGAMPNPTTAFAKMLTTKLKSSGIKITDIVLSTTENSAAKWNKVNVTLLDTINSPSLDKMVYWFMKKSINLYGEAFLNKMGEKQKGNYQTKLGVEVVKSHWQSKGILPKALNISDGSGLSPVNRVTTKALVKILQYSQKQPWFTSYYDAFPNYNEMKLKSGTIGDVKGFSGYHTAKDGTSYIISFLVNNYDGSTKAVVSKMFKVLDVLK
jgi:D-alanyl-D-alanine carboxypeptidase/D-alanyl-D-alanine-endopeptidase (penicillin-binding protein 4)